MTITVKLDNGTTYTVVEVKNAEEAKMVVRENYPNVGNRRLTITYQQPDKKIIDLKDSKFGS
jgi:uncharacterized protein (UPF0179 family)